MTLDGAMITFSSAGGLGQRRTSRTRVYPIDMIIFKVEGEIRKVPARGLCRPANPTNAPARLGCRADSEVGKFEGEFLPSGAEASSL